jgi:hypothetical protein
MKKKINWNTEKILSISAMLIGLMTLIVFIYQTNIQREQQYLSVLPHLSIYHINVEKEGYALVIENNGIGPAFIERVQVYHNEKQYDLDLSQFFFEHTNITDTIKNIEYSNIYLGQVIPPERKHKLLKLKKREDGKKLYDILISNDLDFEVIYKSIYNESWRVSLKNSVPKKR